MGSQARRLRSPEAEACRDLQDRRSTPDGEQLLFVWKGSIKVKDKTGSYSAGEKDTVFVTGPAELEVTAGPEQETIVIHVQAPQAES